jgi:prophage tail gpP-like protein
MADEAPTKITVNKQAPEPPPKEETPKVSEFIGGKPDIARLIVNGRNFEDWESVTVKQELRGNPPQTARFTCSEGSPLVKNWTEQQIMPGETCQVYLGGHLAFDGKVYSRQVFVDARRHQIEIQCANLLELSTASVVTQTGEFKDKEPEQIIRSVLKGVNKKLVVLGGQLPKIKIPRVSVTPGESVIDFIDTITRHLSQNGVPVAHSATPQGDFALVVGPHGGSDEIVEGKNMLEGRETIYIPMVAAPPGGNGGGEKKASQSTLGQRPGTDETWGAAAAHIPYLAKTFSMMGNTLVPGANVPELPVWDKKLNEGRAGSEAGWMTEDYVTVWGTLQGWLRPSGGLWVPGQDVIVTSPMLVMKGEKLQLKSVTYSQDNQQGTRTVLECCNANAMGGAPKAGQ